MQNKTQTYEIIKKNIFKPEIHLTAIGIKLLIGSFILNIIYFVLGHMKGYSCVARIFGNFIVSKLDRRAKECIALD